MLQIRKVKDISIFETDKRYLNEFKTMEVRSDKRTNIKYWGDLIYAQNIKLSLRKPTLSYQYSKCQNHWSHIISNTGFQFLVTHFGWAFSILRCNSLIARHFENSSPPSSLTSVHPSLNQTKPTCLFRSTRRSILFGVFCFCVCRHWAASFVCVWFCISLCLCYVS